MLNSLLNRAFNKELRLNAELLLHVFLQISLSAISEKHTCSNAKEWQKESRASLPWADFRPGMESYNPVYCLFELPALHGRLLTNLNNEEVFTALEKVELC